MTPALMDNYYLRPMNRMLEQPRSPSVEGGMRGEQEGWNGEGVDEGPGLSASLTGLSITVTWKSIPLK